jgi:hypothetical protein
MSMLRVDNAANGASEALQLRWPKLEPDSLTACRSLRPPADSAIRLTPCTMNGASARVRHRAEGYPRESIRSVNATEWQQAAHDGRLRAQNISASMFRSGTLSPLPVCACLPIAGRRKARLLRIGERIL